MLYENPKSATNQYFLWFCAEIVEICEYRCKGQYLGFAEQMIQTKKPRKVPAFLGLLIIFIWFPLISECSAIDSSFEPPSSSESVSISTHRDINPKLSTNYTNSAQKSCGKWMFSTLTAPANSGAISAALKPAMPQPILVTRKVISGCCLAKAMNSST